MKFTIISIRDITGNSFSTPTYHQSKGTALRSFLTEVNRADENNMLYKYPNDFELMYLGTYDDDDASFNLCAYPEQIALAKDYINKQ